MSLIINGIDFDKRCDDAKYQLHRMIEFLAEAYALVPYFNKCHILLEKNNESLAIWMEQRRKNGYTPLNIKWEATATDVAKYVAAIKEYIEDPHTWPRI